MNLDSRKLTTDAHVKRNKSCYNQFSTETPSRVTLMQPKLRYCKWPCSSESGHLRFPSEDLLTKNIRGRAAQLPRLGP